MFSFFKSKKVDPNAEADKGVELYFRVTRLKTVKLEFFQGLLELTDEITQRMSEQYQGLGVYNQLEVEAFCASIITTAVIAADLSDDESLEIIDIYLGLWVEIAVKNYPGTSETGLKSRMNSLCLEYSRMILRAYGESPQQTMIVEESVARNLVRDVDRLAGIQREEIKQAVTAVMFKATIGETIRIVTDLVEEGRRE
ncbi:hypothetical protein ACS4RR_020915 [Rhizobium sp. Z1P35]